MINFIVWGGPVEIYTVHCLIVDNAGLPHAMQLMQFRYKKIFEIVKEAETVGAIISLANIPILFKTKQNAKGYNNVYITQYKRRLCIDLWIFIIIFRWKSREKFV